MRWPRKRKAVLMIGLPLAAATILLVWLASPDQRVARLLGEMSRVPVIEFEFFYFGRPRDQIQSDFDRLGPRAVPRLIAGLNDSSYKIRYLAAEQLGRIGDKRAVEPLIALLDDPESFVHRWVVTALGDLRDVRAVEPLLPFLKNEESSLRYRAAEALGKIGDRRAFESLLPLLDDPQIYPRAHAVEALGSLGDERAFDILVRKLESNENSWIRSMAATGLGRLGDRRAISALTKAADDPYWQINEAAKEALTRLQQK